MSTANAEACCTCATVLSAIPPLYDEKSEKPLAQDRRLDCCGRVICGSCITKNSRFATYCPFCQVSSTPSTLPSGLRDPPAYSPPGSPRPSNGELGQSDDPPPYTPNLSLQHPAEKSVNEQPAEDVLHFLNPTHDSIPSLALQYGVPQEALRRKNGLYADHLLAARKTILIPGEFYKGGVSLSPKPVEGEEEEIRKGKVRRWMVACKVAEYDVALLYLKQSDYDLDAAVEAYLSDEKWEREHPMQANVKGKEKEAAPRRRRFGLSNGITGQLS